MTYKHIVLVGNSGSGKSTVLDLLRNDEQISTIAADELYLTNPFFQLSKQDPHRWMLTNDLWFLSQRVELMQRAINAQQQQHLVIDSGVLMSYVYGQTHQQMGFMTSDEWTFFEECFDKWCSTLVRANKVIFFTAPFEVLRERIIQRNRSFEVKSYFEYLTSLENGLVALEAKLDQLQIPYIKISTVDRVPKQLARDVHDAIKR